MPLVRELALQWWERNKDEMPSSEQEQCFAFLEDYILRFLGEEDLSKLNSADWMHTLHKSYLNKPIAIRLEEKT